jgi:hypothetical protein
MELVTTKIGLFIMLIIIFEKDAMCHHGCNTYAIFELNEIQDIDV